MYIGTRGFFIDLTQFLHPKGRKKLMVGLMQRNPILCERQRANKIVMKLANRPNPSGD